MVTIQGIRSHKFLPIGIQTFMWLWVICENIRIFFKNTFRWITGSKKRNYLHFIKCSNHLSFISTYYGVAIEWEAVWNKISKSLYKRNHHMIKEWNIEVSPEVEKEMVEYAESTIGRVKYELFNFWWHIVKVFTGKWYGSTNDKKQSCVEFVNRVLRIAGYDIPVDANPYELEMFLGEPDYIHHVEHEPIINKVGWWISDNITKILLIVVISLLLWGFLLKRIAEPVEHIVNSYF